MGDAPINKGPHDIGGEAAAAVDTVDHALSFWEKQANGLRSVVTGRRIVRLDELRRAAEDLGDKYSTLTYFERTTCAMRTVLLEKGLITADELTAKIEEIRQRFDVPDEMQSPVKHAPQK